MESFRVGDALLSALDFRRNGKDGTRYVGNNAGGEGTDGKGMILRQQSAFAAKKKK